jgi:hypothetical protein
LYGIVHDADAWHAVFKLDLNSLPSIIGVWCVSFWLH